jgi:methionine sulfoxide reductase heme-binding subunit
VKGRNSLVACLLLAAACLIGLWVAEGELLEALKGIEQARWSGCAALASLLLSASMRPLADLKLISSHNQMTARRHFGITAAVLACLHLALVWRNFFSGNPWWAVKDSPWLQAGAGALALLGILWLTSYPKLVKLLRIRNWKTLHRFAYAAALLAVVHLVLSPWVDVFVAALVAGYVMILMIWRLVFRARKERRTAAE